MPMRSVVFTSPVWAVSCARIARLPLGLLVLALVVAAGSVRAQAPGDARNVGPTVAIVIYEGVELLDFAGPGEVFSSLPRSRVVTVNAADDLEPICSMGFVDVTPEFTHATCPKPDIIVVPGGGVPTPSAGLVAWLRACVARGGVVMSVCNGALVLARAGLLEGLEATTHHSAFEALALCDPTIRVVRNRRFVDHGSVVTTAGISAGIDGSLAVVQRLYGDEVARDVVAYMEYDWRPDEIAAGAVEPADVVDLGLAGDLLLSLRDGGAEDVLAKQRASLGTLDGEVRAEVERLLNLGGYALLIGGHLEQAADVFEFQVDAFPESVNPLDSLAECCERRGDVARAVELSRRVLSELPHDTRVAPARAERIRAAASARIERLAGVTASATTWCCPPCGASCDGLSFGASGACPQCGMPLEPREKS